MARRIRQTKSNTTNKGIPLLNLNSVADITQVNESLNKIDELLGEAGNKEELTTHISNLIINGVHGIKYDISTKQLQYQATPNGEWLPMEIKGTGTVSVSGLTAETLKYGVTVVITQDGQELKRVVGIFTGDATATASQIAPNYTAYVKGEKISGTFTNDATATASDLLSGKTAYVGGKKIIGSLDFSSIDNTIRNIILKVGE